MIPIPNIMCTSEKLVEEILHKAHSEGKFEEVHSLAKKIKSESTRMTFSEAVELAYNKLSR